MRQRPRSLAELIAFPLLPAGDRPTASYMCLPVIEGGAGIMTGGEVVPGLRCTSEGFAQ
jgi:hypothetical protein